MPPFSPPSPHARRRFLLFAAGYFVVWLATWYSARLLDILGSASLWYLPAGLRFCCLLLLGWPGVLLELATNLLVTLLHLASSDAPLPPFGSMAMFWWFYDWYALVLAYAVVLLPLRARMRQPWDLSRPLHGLLFLAAALCVSTLAALAGSLHLRLAGAVTAAQWPQVWVSWLTGDCMGIIVLAPLLLVRVWPRLRLYLEQGRRSAAQPRLDRSRPARARADFQIAAIVLLALLLVFGLPQLLQLRQPVPLTALLLLLPLVAVALRYNLDGAVLAVVLLDSGLVLALTLSQLREQALQYQLVMAAIALVGLWLGGAVESRNRHVLRSLDFASASNDLLWESDRDGRLLNVEGRLARHLALAPGQNWDALLERVSAPHRAALKSTLARRQPFRYLELATLSAAGVATRWIQVNGLPLWDAQGELTGYRGTATDITRAHRAKTLLTRYNRELRAEVAQQTLDLRQSNSELQSKEQHLRVLLAAAPVGLLELDATGCCGYLNAIGASLSACTPQQALGRHLLEFVHTEDRIRVQRAWLSQRHSSEVQALEFRLSGSALWCSAYWIQSQKDDSALDGTVMVLTDATARRQQYERLWTLAHHDPLTELPNRNLFWDRCAQALSLAKRQGNGAAMLLLDLDGFKGVNDRLGHAAGDALLQQVAQWLKGRIRDSDTVARIGGDEFAVVMPDIGDAESAARVAEALLASLETPFDLPQGQTQISASIGLALYPQHAQDVETLAKCADMAMYSAKHGGRNRIQLGQVEVQQVLC